MNNNDHDDNDNIRIALDCIGVILLFCAAIMFFAVP